MNQSDASIMLAQAEADAKNGNSTTANNLSVTAGGTPQEKKIIYTMESTIDFKKFKDIIEKMFNIQKKSSSRKSQGGNSMISGSNARMTTMTGGGDASTTMANNTTKDGRKG